MVAEGMNYPLHLGVTEAGDGEDGRIKSAVGIGTLLEDGLGDTVRVSLTEEPEAEAPVAIELVKRYSKRKAESKIKVKNQEAAKLSASPFTHFHSPHNPLRIQKTRNLRGQRFIGGHMVPRVVVDLSKRNLKDPGYERMQVICTRRCWINITWPSNRLILFTWRMNCHRLPCRAT
jgi:(E)-4-hydroxy-3-methylbut-2-enyl-diphosphate synthase